MNKELIIAAFQYAQEQGIPHGRHAYFDPDTGCMCAVGILALRAGVPLSDIGILMIGGSRESAIVDHIQDHYELDNFDNMHIIKVNDESWNSWNDAIESIKAWQDGD